MWTALNTPCRKVRDSPFHGQIQRYEADPLEFGSIATGLGLGMVVGGGILKVPQIAKIVSTRSTRGLSLSAFVSHQSPTS